MKKKKTKDIYNEYTILSLTSDIDNIIKISDVFEDELYFLLILQELKKPDISEYLDKNGPLKILNVKKIIFIIANVLKEIHKKSIIHIDIKPDNIMCDFNGKVYLFDFGLSRLVKDSYGCCSGTIYYISPEIVNNICSDNKNYLGTETDIWSLGVTMFVMLFKEYPFFSDYDSNILSIIKNYDITNHIKFKLLDPNGQDLLLKCLDKNPKKRIKAADIVNHSWLNENFY